MWLLETRIRKQIEAAEKSGFVPSAEQQLSIDALGADSSGILSIAGNKADIQINGVLTNQPSFMARIFGGGNTTYPEIISAIVEADNDDSIDEIILSIDSPGGSIDGLFDALAAIEATETPTKAVVSNQAASAAFAIASQADTIEATNIGAQFGSVGIVATMFVDDHEISITNTESPDKRPDVTTAKGRAVIQGQLDDIHELFADAIATGRKTTVKKVNADFGKGVMFLAGKALERGMIDSVAGKKPTAISGKQTEAINMDLKTLKAEHSDVYDAVVQIGLDLGITKERDRVGAHLTAGQGSGQMDTAIKAVLDGTEMTQQLSMSYMMAAVNRGDIKAVNDDDDDADDKTNDKQSGKDDKDAIASAAILKLAADAVGIELEGV